MNDMIENKISSIKEVLSNLPKNNIKNQKRYLENVMELKNEYSKMSEEIYRELNDRYHKIMDIDKNPEILKLEEQLKNSYSYLYLLNDNTTSYEKSGLDRILFDLSHFYKVNLDRVNEDIGKAISVFKRVGINLNKSDFCYSSYVSSYMGVYLDSNCNFDVLEDTFEKIYWKCSDIIIHIELNFKYLYWKNKKVFDRYYEKEKSNFLKNVSCDEKGYFEYYKGLKRDYDELVLGDSYTIYRDFISKKYNVGDYMEGKIEKCFEDMFSVKIDKDDYEESISNISKLYHSLVEYKSYMKFDLFVNDVKKIYADKDKYKNVVRDKFKSISKLESKLFSYYKKLNRNIRFGKKEEVIQNLNFQINYTILELKKLYDELDMDRFCENVSKLEEHTSSFDILSLVSSYYLYVRNVLKVENEEVNDEEVEGIMLSLYELLSSPYITIICNIMIGEDRNIPMVISDRYKLMNFNINPDTIDIGNIDSMIDTAYKILLYDKINKNGISISDIRFVCEMDNVTSKN